MSFLLVSTILTSNKLWYFLIMATGVLFLATYRHTYACFFLLFVLTHCLSSHQICNVVHYYNCLDWNKVCNSSATPSVPPPPRPLGRQSQCLDSRRYQTPAPHWMPHECPGACCCYGAGSTVNKPGYSIGGTRAFCGFKLFCRLRSSSSCTSCTLGLFSVAEQRLHDKACLQHG